MRCLISHRQTETGHVHRVGWGELQVRLGHSWWLLLTLDSDSDCDPARWKDKGCKNGNVNLSNGWTTADSTCETQLSVRLASRAMGDSFFSPSVPVHPQATVCFLHSSSNPMPKSRLQQKLQPIWPFWSKTNLCVQAEANRNICANVACLCEDLAFGNVCRHTVVIPRGPLSELRPFAQTAWLLVSKPNGWEGGQFHLPNIPKCGKVKVKLQMATTLKCQFVQVQTSLSFFPILALVTGS